MEFDKINAGNEKVTHDTGAKRELKTAKGRYDLLPKCAIHRLARHFENGAVLHGDENWRKGLPLMQYLNSAMRHIFQLQNGEMDEDHAAAVIWNVACFIETQQMIEDGKLPKTLDDYSTREWVTKQHPDKDSSVDTPNAFFGSGHLLPGFGTNVTLTVDSVTPDVRKTNVY